MHPPSRPILVACTLLLCAFSAGAQRSANSWTVSRDFRVRLTVESPSTTSGRAHTGRRSHSPVAVEFDFSKALASAQARGSFDEHTVEVVAADVAPGKRPAGVPHRVDRLLGHSATTLHFVMPDERQTNYFVYFDTLESGRGKPRRYPGLVGDGDKLMERFGRREIAASHFDTWADFDRDGDLDLFKGGVEPFVSCWENLGGNRLVPRGRLASGGAVLRLPCSRSNRSWLTVAFYDIDRDGDLDFFPSFGDGPESGRIVFYRNVTREHDGQLTFSQAGALQSITGVPLAGGAQAGGWFPSIAFAQDWDGDGDGPDALVGSRHRGWLYRGLGTNTDGTPRFADAIALQANGRDIELVNPRFECADVDADGDLDLLAATQPGAVHLFKNIGGSAGPQLSAGVVVAWSGRYLIGDAHSGVQCADFDGDGLRDIVTGRFWERTDLNAPSAPHDFGGYWKNVGVAGRPRFERRSRGAPLVEGFLPCDAVRQNGVRAVDWDADGQPDLLAGDTDGFIWFFRNRGDRAMPIFEHGERLLTNGGPLCVASSGGHARFDTTDWNNNGRRDLVIADGEGTVRLFVHRGRLGLGEGVRLEAGGKPLQLGGRASVLVCDWDNDQRKDLVLADDRGFYFSRNTGLDSAPVLAPSKPILFAGKTASYVRPNLGSFVDWDGDGRRDFIVGHFENSIRYYRNLGSGAPGEEPRFADPEGVTLVTGESPQMISGVDALDWNGDGDIDVLTGQGHGGSGLRLYERDWIEDELRGTHPGMRVGQVERRH